MPDGLVVGEDPEFDAKWFRRTDERYHARHPADDRQVPGSLPGEPMIEVLSVASEALSAGQDRWARRCGRRPAAGSRCLRGVDADAGAGLSGRHGRGGRAARWSRKSAISSAGSARLIAGRVQGLDLIVVDAPHLYDRPGNPYVEADGTDLAGQLAALRGAELRRRTRSVLGRIDGRLRPAGGACARLAGRPGRRPTSNTARRR